MKVPADLYARSARVYRGLEDLTYPVPRSHDRRDALRPDLFQGAEESTSVTSSPARTSA